MTKHGKYDVWLLPVRRSGEAAVRSSDATSLFQAGCMQLPCPNVPLGRIYDFAWPDVTEEHEYKKQNCNAFAASWSR